MKHTYTAWSVALALVPSLLLAGAGPKPRAQARASEPLFEQTDLFRSGEGGVHTYRIPALAVTAAGSLIAVADARHENAGDLPGVIDLVMRRSTDLGRTWAAAVTIRDAPGRSGAGDASLLVDPRTGRIFCFYAYGPPGVGFFRSEPCNAAADNCLHAQLIFSDDDGRTWSEPVELTQQLRAPDWDALFASSGHGIGTRAGRLVQPFVMRKGKQTWAANAWSDDSGRTWRMGGRAGTNVNESKVVELEGGALRQDIRHNDAADAARVRFAAISRDGGVTFGPMTPTKDLVDPWVNADILRHDAGPRPAILFSNPADARERRRLTVRASFDEARSWPHARVVHAGPAAYSTMAVLPDGTVGLLYERGEDGPYETITFARFGLDWLKP